MKINLIFLFQMKTEGLIIVVLISGIYGKPSNSTYEEPVCGYNSCHAVDPNKINVHLIPHSHDDVGWLKTVDQYYYQDVQYTISSVIQSLLRNSDRRFIQVETAYFYKWWNLQDDSVKSDVKKLINEGRLEIVNGAWSMNDEAAVHYQSTIDQYTIGLRFIEDILGKCGRPRVGWQIDPFGHSREQASLLTQFGMDGVFFSRIDYRDKIKREKEKTMDMLWTGSANLGSDSNIFTSVFIGHYNAPPNFCFDIDCQDPSIVTDKNSPEYNWEKRVRDFGKFISDQYKSYPTNNLLITLGGDFRWKAAQKSYINVDRLIEGFKFFNPKIDDKEVNVIYSTPSCYTKAVHDYVENKKMKLDVKTDDFFPFSHAAHTVWTGYFSSRPTSKRLERLANNLLQVSKQITALGREPYATNNLLSHAMGVMQHHDAITGTEKTHVEKDYHRSIAKGMQAAISNISSSFSSILGADLKLKSCLLSNVSICTESSKDKFTALIYNPLARNTSHYIQIPVNDGTWKINGPQGEDVESHLTDPITNFDYITKDTKEKVLGKVLFFRAENLPALGYKVYNFQRVGSKSQESPQRVRDIDEVGFSDRYVNFHHDTGLLKSITLNGATLPVSQKMLYYVSSDSGAYVFQPEKDTKDAFEFGPVRNTVLINEGNVIREIKQVWKDWATQIIRIYKEEDFIEFDWLVGPVDLSDKKGKEIITRYTTGLKTGGVFYTDSNGREIIYRKNNYRPTYNYTNEEPQAGNYYPVNTKILIKDGKHEFAVLPDRSEGGSSLSSGEVELMLSRALLHKDGNIGENLNEMEYNRQLVARGSHFVTLGDASLGNGGRTMAAVERDIAQRKLLQPWVFFTSEDVPVKEQSFLKKELPANVHLLTLESWNETDSSLLIRFEHILQKDEDPKLSKEVTIDISVIFKTFKIKSMKEFLLAANTPLEESTRLKWSQISKTEDESSPLNIKTRIARDETDLKITLAPMQIRTFVATIEKK